MHEALSHRKAPPRVPRFVTALNRVAEGAGFRTEMRVGRFYSNNDERHLIGIWRGPMRAFMGLKFLPPSTLRRVHSSKTISISWPERLHPIIDGNVEVLRKGVKFELSFCTLPRAIRTQGEIEIIETSDGYHDWAAHYGTKEALVTAGSCEERHFPTPKRVCKSGWQDSPEWKTLRYPDGNFLHWRETEESAKRQHRPDSAAQRAPDLSGFTSIEDYRHALQRFMPMHVGYDPNCLARFDGQKSNDGYVYGIAAESRERIEEAISELYWALQDVEISRRKFDARTDEEKAAARELLARAEADPKFQRFMGALALPRPGSTL